MPHRASQKCKADSVTGQEEKDKWENAAGREGGREDFIVKQRAVAERGGRLNQRRISQQQLYRGSVLLISRRICIKYGRLVNLSESSSMRFISQHTSIPVPKVICAFTDRGWTYIVMERIDGDMVGSGWLNRSAESKTKILSHLKELIQEVRSLSPPQGRAIANVDGGSLYDCRLSGPHYDLGHLAISLIFTGIYGVVSSSIRTSNLRSTNSLFFMADIGR